MLFKFINNYNQGGFMKKNMDARDIAIIASTVFIPPLGVALKKGFKLHFWLNLGLTVFGFYFAGLVHGLYVVLAKDNEES